MDIDNILVELEIIGQLKENDKLAISVIPGDTKIFVSQYSWYSGFIRKYNGYNRDACIKHVETLVDRIEKTSNTIINGTLVDMCITIKTSIKKAVYGLNNLKTTYDDCAQSQARINVIIDKIKEDFIPIISPLGLGPENKTYNINGDTAAGAIAKSLKSRRLLLMTNVEGVLDKDKNLIEEISSSKVMAMIEDKTITEGMIPKINTCLDAVKNGVTAVAIIDGRKKHSVLFEIFSDKGSGTLIRK